jgi:hypothetical protein
LSGSDARAGLRIAFAFAAALTLAEASDIEVSFIAPLAAVTLAAAPARVAPIVVLPLLVGMLAVLAAIAVQLLAGMPIVLAVLLFGLFMLGFVASAAPRTAALGLFILVVFAVLPDMLARYPEATNDIILWTMRDLAIAAGSALLAGWVVGGPPAALAQRAQAQPLSPAVSAAVLLLAVLVVWANEPKAAAPILFSVIITLRSDGEPPGRIIVDRFLGAAVGGAAALLATSIGALAPSLPVLFIASLTCAYPLALQAARGGRWGGMAMKGLKAMAILTGQGLSVLYEDTADQFETRFGGVILGLGFVALALLVLGRGGALRSGLQVPSSATTIRAPAVRREATQSE